MGGVGQALQKTYDVLVKGETPQAPALAPPPPPPTPATSSDAQDAAAKKERDRSSRGRASTMLTGASGLSSTATTSGRTLLGS